MVMGDEIIELFTEINIFNNELGEYPKKWLKKQEQNSWNFLDEEKGANCFMRIMEKQSATSHITKIRQMIVIRLLVKVNSKIIYLYKK